MGALDVLVLLKKPFFFWFGGVWGLCFGRKMGDGGGYNGRRGGGGSMLT